ncbi:hypothetical protein GOBAR_DD35773 [Gossypium barbadense]|nr:hypothetical protein GOBAR_DD35773 [Gossypium barbadense]
MDDREVEYLPLLPLNGSNEEGMMSTKILVADVVPITLEKWGWVSKRVFYYDEEMLRGRSSSDGDLMGKSTKTPFDGEGSTTHVAKSQEKTITNPTGSPTVISIPMTFMRTIIDLHRLYSNAKIVEDKALAVVGKWKATEKKYCKDRARALTKFQIEEKVVDALNSGEGLKALGGEAGREPKASNGSEDPPYNDLVKSVEGGSDVEN